MAENLLSTTQRAYTVRLRGAKKEDNSWQEPLWKTHEAVNKGAKAFGDWLLTLRGGLCHTLASCNNADAEKKHKAIVQIWNKLDNGKRGTEPTLEDARKQVEKERRILLALSWLSVESEDGAPKKLTVANEKIIIELQRILKTRRVPDNEVESWVKDCSASLLAAIRDDAVWVNRSDAFETAVQNIGSSLNRDEIWDIFERFFNSPQAYLKAISVDGDSESQDEEKIEDLVQKAGNWLSNRFGGGKGSDWRAEDSRPQIVRGLAHALGHRLHHQRIANGYRLGKERRGIPAIFKGAYAQVCLGIGVTK
jgi:hypothetical protein